MQASFLLPKHRLGSTAGKQTFEGKKKKKEELLVSKGNASQTLLLGQAFLISQAAANSITSQAEFVE